MSVGAISFGTLRRALRQTIVYGGLYVIPVVLTALVLAPYRHGYAYDFRIFRLAGKAYLHGRSPYPPASLAVLKKQHSFVYPAPMAALFVPFALLPVRLGALLFGLFLAGCVVAMLRILRIEDRRLYSIAFLLLPVVLGLRFGTFSPVLALLVALLWRYRDRTWPAALAFAAIVVSKLFLAPLVVWLLVTRRWRAAVLGSLVAAAVTLVAWAPIGFASFTDYRHILSLLATGEERESFSLASLGLASGLDAHWAHLVAEGVAGVVLLAAAVVGLRPGPRACFVSFTLVIAGSLALSPIVWNHYFIVLLVPLALVAPRLERIWIAPFALWLVPAQSYHQLAPIAVGVVAPAVALGWAILLASRRPRATFAAAFERPPNG